MALGSTHVSPSTDKRYCRMRENDGRELGRVGDTAGDWVGHPSTARA